MKNIDEECPLEGAKTVTKNVELPKEIPPVRKCDFQLLVKLTVLQGQYTVLADVYTEGNEKITCLEASVKF